MRVTDDRAIRHAFTAFGGARCEVIVCGGRDDGVSSLVADTYAFERRLTRFDPGSELSHFNAAAGARVRVSALLGELLRTCLDAYELSGGLVNAACLRALIEAGYDRSITEAPPPPGWPPSRRRQSGRTAVACRTRSRRRVGTSRRRLRSRPGWRRQGLARGHLVRALRERRDQSRWRRPRTRRRSRGRRVVRDPLRWQHNPGTGRGYRDLRKLRPSVAGRAPPDRSSDCGTRAHRDQRLFSGRHQRASG